MDKTLYKDDSIQSLDPLAFVRLKPELYAGTTEDSTQLVIEVLANAVDEFKLGHGTKISISYNPQTNWCAIADHGQGFLVNKKREEDGKTVLEAAFSVLNTSGKFTEDGVYEGTSLGTYGIGAKLTNFLSHELTVETSRDGQSEMIRFVEGVFSSRTIAKVDKNISGTCVSWQASEEFFTNPAPNMKAVHELCNVLTCLCPGLTIIIKEIGKNDVTYYAPNGISALVDKKVEDKEIIKRRLNLNYSDSGKNKLDLVMTYTSSYASNVIAYVNTGFTDSGPHITQIKTLLTREFNKFFREKGWLKEKDSNLSGEDIQEGLFLIFNVTAPNVAYDSQTKSRIAKIDMKPFTTAITEELQIWLLSNEKEIKNIADKALNARKAREAAKKARDAARGTKVKKESSLKAKMALSNKFIDCSNKKAKERNLLLVEGLSAGSAAIEARNPKTDCIYMLRGKTISPLKTSVDKILANQEMSDIIKVIGAGFDKSFDVSKMNFNKIVITSDQDSDGLNIELLLITFFYTYMRPLVEAGMLYRAVTPLYIVRQKDKEYYCYSEEELIEWKENHKGSYDLLRAKGLGELNAADLRKVCFENERFKRITVIDAKKTTELLEILMGSNVDLRKKYVYENATELGFNFD